MKVKTNGAGQNFWLAVASSDNCECLSKMGHPFYALSGAGSKLAESIKLADQIILYRAARGAGFVGIFEATHTAIKGSVRLQGQIRPFAVKIPWRPLALCETRPVQVRPLIDRLEFVTNKSNFGMSLRTNLRPISECDFRLIAAEIYENISAQDTVARRGTHTFQ